MRRVIKNFFALLALQGGNYLLPLLLIPFLVRVLGVEVFGNWVIATAIVAIFRTCVAYGFDLTATKAVANNTTNTNFLSAMYSSIVIVRAIVLVLSLLLFLLVANFFKELDAVRELTVLCFLVLIGEVLFPIWLFQGQEHMSTITYVRLSYRFGFVLIVLFTIRSPEDVFLIPVIEACGSFLSAVIAMSIAFRRYKLRLLRPKLELILEMSRTGFSVFFAYISVHFYTSINTVILGVVAGPTQVAFWAIAEKIFYAIRGLMGPAVQAIYPMLSRAFLQETERYRKLVRISLVSSFVALLIFGSVLFFMSEILVSLVSGAGQEEAVKILNWLCLAMLFGIGSLLSPLLIIQGQDARLIQITTVSMVINLIMVYPMVLNFGGVGVAMTFLFTQSVQTILQLYANDYIFPNKLNSN